MKSLKSNLLNQPQCSKTHQLEQSQSFAPTYLKQKANKLFNQGNYIDALTYYDDAIQAEKDKYNLIKLFNNKSLTLINLNCIHDALDICQMVLYKFNTSNTKTLYLKITLLILCDRFEDANNLMEQQKSIFSQIDLKRLKSKMQLRKNCKNGKINWAKAFQSLQIQQYFNHKLEIKKSDVAKSLGIFCVQDINPFQPLIVEKPISSIYFQNVNNNSKKQNQQNIKLKNQCEKLYQKTKQGKNKILGLWDQMSSDLLISQRRQQNIDQERIDAKIRMNSLTVNDLKKVFQDDNILVTGIWQKISLINHRCLPNASIFCLGNTIVLMSDTKINKGQQIYISYHFNPQICLRKWKIQCNCQYCLQYPIYQKLHNSNKKNYLNAMKSLRVPKFQNKLLNDGIFEGNKEVIKYFRQFEQQLLSTYSLHQIFDLFNIILNTTPYLMKSVVYLVKKIFGTIHVLKPLTTPAIYQLIQEENID